MLAGMTSLQFSEWMAFYKIEADSRPNDQGQQEGTASMEDRLKQSLMAYQGRRDARKRK